MRAPTSSRVSRLQTLTGISLAGILFVILLVPSALAQSLVLARTLPIDKTLVPALMLLAFSGGLLFPYVARTIFRSTAREQLLKYALIIQKSGGIHLIVFGIWLLLLICYVPEKCPVNGPSESSG